MIRGHERGIVPFAVAMLLITLVMVDGAVGASWTGAGGTVVAVIGVVSVPGCMLGLLLHLTVVWFNRPKFSCPAASSGRQRCAPRAASARPRAGRSAQSGHRP